MAGARGAGVVDLLAGRPGESVGAGAPVLVGRGVLAGAAVLAGLVGAAVVEVLVAEDAAPVGVADALPARAVAVAVLAARVRGALVAEIAAPAMTALALAGDVAVAVDRVATLLADRCNESEDAWLVFGMFIGIWTGGETVGIIYIVSSENIVVRNIFCRG